MPVIQHQDELDQKLDHGIITEVNELKEKTTQLEQSVYGKSGPELRFDQIEDEIREIKKNRHSDFSHFKSQISKIEMFTKDETFQMNERVKRVLSFEKNIDD